MSAAQKQYLMLSTGKIFLQHLPLTQFISSFTACHALLWRLRFLSLKLAKSQNVRLGDNFKALRASLLPKSRQQKMRVRSLCAPATPPTLVSKEVCSHCAQNDA